MAFKTKNAGVSWCISMFENGGKDDNLTEVLNFFRDDNVPKLVIKSYK